LVYTIITIIIIVRMWVMMIIRVIGECIPGKRLSHKIWMMILKIGCRKRDTVGITIIIVNNLVKMSWWW
jgi:hypothetical protein